MTARLSPKDWQKIRTAWETDERTNYGWLPEYAHIKVSRQAIEKRARAEGWKKQEKLRPAPPKPPKPPKKDPKVAAKLRQIAKEVDEPKVATNDPVATKSKAAEEVIKNKALKEFEQLFVLEYLKDFDATKAARRTGYKGKNPRAFGYKTLQNPQIQAALRKAVATRAEAIGVDGDRLMQLWSDIVSFDVNELTEFRRIPCPWCYAKNGKPQMTIGNYYTEKKLHEKKRESILEGSNGETDIGEYPSALMFEFVDPNKTPNPDCPVCHGMGDGMRLMKDTRYLSARAKLMYCGTESTKDGYNFATLNREKAIDNLAKALFLFREKEVEEQLASARPEELTKRFNETMALARKQQVKALKARGMDEADVVDVWPEETAAEKKEGENNGGA